jgi:hypothetical protein
VLRRSPELGERGGGLDLRETSEPEKDRLCLGAFLVSVMMRAGGSFVGENWAG